VPRAAVVRALRRAGKADADKVGKAAEPLGVVADRFDGLAQGNKRAQAGSGTADGGVLKM